MSTNEVSHCPHCLENFLVLESMKFPQYDFDNNEEEWVVCPECGESYAMWEGETE